MGVNQHFFPLHVKSGRCARIPLHVSGEHRRQNLHPTPGTLHPTPQTPIEYAESGPCWEMAWAFTDNPAFQIEINAIEGRVRHNTVETTGRAAAASTPHRGVCGEAAAAAHGVAVHQHHGRHVVTRRDDVVEGVLFLRATREPPQRTARCAAVSNGSTFREHGTGVAVRCSAVQ